MRARGKTLWANDESRMYVAVTTQRDSIRRRQGRNPKLRNLSYCLHFNNGPNLQKLRTGSTAELASAYTDHSEVISVSNGLTWSGGTLFPHSL